MMIPEAMKEHQAKKAKAALKKIEKSYAENFYVLDTETTGFKHNEPLQISALLFLDGK